MESVLPIRKFHITNYALLIPFNGVVSSGSGGKIQRKQSPIVMTWDDGTKMKMVFQQGVVEVPSKSNCAPGAAYLQYPKALTSNSSGEELDVYLRKCFGLPSNAIIAYNNLHTYGRDYVTLIFTNSRNYEIDVTPNIYYRTSQDHRLSPTS